MKKHAGKWIAAFLLVLLGIGEMLMLRRWPGVFFPGYRQFSKWWISVLAALFSLSPWSVWDVGALCLVLTFMFFLILAIRRRRGFSALSGNTALTAAVLLFAALQGWLGNHYAPKLSEEINLNVRTYRVEELYESCERYLLEAAEHAGRISRDEEGHAQPMNFRELAGMAGSSYTGLAQQYSVFAGSSKPVKRFTLIGDYLLYNGIIGMFMPITGEASVPYHVPTVPLPYTMCHEAAHRLGIASEQEANFCAFLACISSSDERFLYSGYYSAFGYCFNSLCQADPEMAVSLIEQYQENEAVRLVFLDRRDTALAYDKYDSRLQEVSDSINDTYLKTFSHESGIRSYGEVTDYLIAWHLSGRKVSEAE